MRIVVVLVVLLFGLNANAQKKNKKDYLVSMETSKGMVHLILFDETPLHKANFIKLAEEGFYNGTLFHRVKNEFMIQGGDPLSKNAVKGARLGAGGTDRAKIPYEFVPEHIHLKGALAAARSNNPEKASSACQFYIVTGKKYNEQQLKTLAGYSKNTGEKLANGEKEDFAYTEKQLTGFKEMGGTPFLDNNYTVFGEVISGIDAVDAIQLVDVDRSDRPIEDVSMKVSVKKMKKKKITKLYGYTYQ
jgi:cyclophilin family peptidyl-prolyl cis-trans isomerase